MRDRRTGPEPVPEPTLPTGPAVDLLDAARRGDWTTAAELLPPDAAVEVSALRFSESGGKAREVIAEVLTLFPDLAYEPHTRGSRDDLIVDHGFVTGTYTGGSAATGNRLTMTVEVGARQSPAAVRSLTITLDRTALAQALGIPVDRSAALYSEVQALRAGMYDGLEVHSLAPVVVEPPPPAPATPQPPARTRRRGLIVGGIVALLLMAGGVVVFALSSQDSNNPSVTPPLTTPTASATHSPSPTTTPTPSPTPTPTPKPNVILSADLAFGIDSADISASAREAIIKLASKARHLSGVIRVDGYTDNVGSSQHGLVLSQARADAVAAILRQQLRSNPNVTILPVGHGEADPVASNATASGRSKNRRVTITLPPTSG